MNLERRFTRQILRVLLLTALLLPGWQMFTVGQETLKNIPPWNYITYNNKQCGDSENKTFPYAKLNNTGQTYNADANDGWGKRVERGDKKDDREKKAMVYLVFNTSRTVPPYAQEIMDWGYSFCCQSDKSESLGSLYYFRDSISTWDTYVNTDHKVSACDDDELKDYIVEEHRDLSSNGGIFDDVCRITFDNSYNSEPGTVTQWLLMVGEVAGSSNTGHTKVTIKTTSANYMLYYPRFNGAGTAESPLQIASGADLKAFATIINSGAGGTARLHAVLTNDIDYTQYTDASAMIGTGTAPYKGVFDGQGHSVTLALNNTTEEYTGLFGHADSASIRNLEVTGSMTGLRMLGGVVGNATGITTLEKVTSSVSITASSSTERIGGLISAVGDDKAAWTYTIRNCAFTGSITGDFSKMVYNGLSYVREPSTLNITNCYTAVQTASGSTRGENFAVLKGSKAKVNVTNSYYTKQIGSSTQGTQVTDEQMASGEVCFKLNGSKDYGTPWLQTIGVNKTPVLWNALPVYGASGAYHNYEPPFPGAGTEQDPFELETAQELMQFRNIVNGGDYAVCAKLVADIDLANYNWEPIGRSTGPYKGIFDGKGFIISNLNVNTNEDYHGGLFGVADGATIKNVIVRNATVHAPQYAGVIAGRIGKTTVLENCGVYGIVKLTSDASSVSGIADVSEDAGIKNSYTVFTNISQNPSANIINCYCGTDVEDKCSSGELTFLLNDKAPTPWVQTLGENDYPQLRNALSVYKDATGGYYNDAYKGGDEYAFAESMSRKDFRVIHHGGRLYEFVITMATQDSKGIFTSPDAQISYNADGSWTKIFTLSDINKDSLSFSQDWWGKIDVIKGTTYDTRTYHTQVPTFWIRQGNHTTCKQTSLLWLAPEDMTDLPTQFQLRGVAEDSKLNISTRTEATTAPGDESGLMFVDPLIAASYPEAGSAMMVVSASNKMYGFALWDATDNCFISAQEFTEETTSFEAYMPQQECEHDIVALVYSRAINSDNSGKQDTVYVNYSYPFVQYPAHSILRTNISSNYNASNLIEWAIAFPNDSDILEEQYVLARGYSPDYSDVGTQVAFDRLDTLCTTTQNDTLFGWYSYVDTLAVDHASLVQLGDTVSVFDTWDIPQTARDVLQAYKYPASYLYYKAYRPSVAALWAEHSKFEAFWKVLQTDVLPTVDTVRIIKDDNFDQNHKIKVRVILNNPYPWDLVSESDRDAVMEAAQKNLFDHPMFVWDENASITLERFSNSNEYENGKDLIAKLVTLNGNQVKQDPNTFEYYVEYSDIASLPFIHYYYQAKVDKTKSDYPICEDRNKYVVCNEPCYSDRFATITNLKATRGTMTGAVEVTWECDENDATTIELKRREYRRGYDSSKELAGWSSMTVTGGSSIDDIASAAVVNEYVLSVRTKYRDIDTTQTDTTYGYSAYYGSLNGRVKMPNGVNMPGNVSVTVEGDGPFTVQEVKDPGTGEVVMPAYSTDMVQFTVQADKNGAYELDSVPFYGSGCSYTVFASCEGATFVSPTGSASTITLAYEDANYEYTGIDFTCNDTRHFSGRILYTNSTVPVRDVYFKVNGTILRDAEGEPVKTDAMGNFSFIVPRMEVTVQAYRPGHKMSNDGYILGGDDGQQRTFTPTKDYDGLIIDDDTKVRLVGRVSGGVIQGAKPMGFGLSDNNLGDSITLVLTLEGDHTSYLYFDKKDPDKTSYTDHFTQSVNTAMGKKEIIPTDVSFEAKRIVVKADNETGEFCLDLFPTKYTVSQIYANGYSTLYSAGEGLTVLDLTDSVGLHTHMYDGDWTKYDGSFCKVYHAPVQVDLLQLRSNKFRPIYGEETMEVGMLSGTQQMQLSWMDTAETAQYAMGYPVYKGYKQYFFQVSAYEPYYYNNVSTGAFDRVPMAGYKVTVNNGLSDSGEADDEDGLVLSDDGLATFNVTPDNTTFALTEEDALRHLSVSVDVNGYKYESEPIAAFVTGERDFGVEVVDAMEGAPQILDYIRDPYGSGSYAYRTTGTSYNWARSYESESEEFFEMDLGIGVGLIQEISAGFLGSSTEYEVSVNGNLTSITKHDITNKDGEFTLTLSDQLSTSDDPADQGAMADVYLGSVSTADVVKYQAFNVVDSATYQALLPAVATGAARLVAEGENAEGHPYYLVICGGVAWEPGQERVFVYSQRYIVNMLIPKLEARRAEALRLAGSYDEATSMAASSGRTFYYVIKNGEYEPVFPPTMEVRKDTVEMLTDQIEEWQNVIAENERLKYEAMSDNADFYYSVAGTTIEHSEEASTYYRVRNSTGPKPTTGGIGGGSSNSDTDGGLSEKNTGGSDPKNKSGLKGLSILYNAQFSGGWDGSSSNEMSDYTTMDGGSGFVIATSDDSYFDIDVHYQKDASIVTVNSEFRNDINAYEGGSGLEDYEITGEGQKMTDENTYVHNYVFVMRGGATREPWIDADSTLYYYPDDKNSVPLGVRTLRIDNPRLYVEQPVVNNLPQDEKAVFTLHLSNESELDYNVQDVSSSLFLNIADDSNPDGAVITIDGRPLLGSIEFAINPGEAITKTLEVERGGKPYDYDNIELELSDGAGSVSSSAFISVHYLPTSTPVTLTLPAQNFLINTLSQTDEDGKYYIPVQIEGFSTTKYDNFDHIELQYKRQTDGEDQWVNQCSYFADEKLYAAASGTKAMIETEGKISDIRFYGEQDPVEQKYDLRAVSFCRLGNGYTTRYSSVISGTKDTRCPEVFGLPKPQDGILDFDDVISLPFTEPIAYNYLDETANFSVKGYTNNSDADNSISLYFAGTDAQSAATSVDRILNSIDFSVEMNIKVDGDAAGQMQLITINDDYSEDASKAFVFGYNADEDVLIALMNGQRVATKPIKATYGINLASAMTHVGMVYSVADSTARFYVSEQEVYLADEYRDLRLECHANGVVNLGTGYQGHMNNIRLWSKALSDYEMSSKYKKVLSANESNLLGYWPADEGIGTTVKDRVNGADFTLQGVTWNLPNGYSVDLDHKTMDILPQSALKYTRDTDEDYTISFYFKVDELSGDANLFAAGSDALEEEGQNKVRIRFIDGELYFVSEGEQYTFGDNDLVTDAAWHYLAVTVNHAQNSAALFVDGQMVNETSADAVGGVTGSVVCYGDDSIRVHIDQIQMWSMALSASYIKRYYNAALTGKEKELQIYLPFEREEMNEQGTMYTTFSAYNHVIPEGATEIAGDTVINETLVAADSKVISPVRSSTGIENLPFRWKSTENELQIEINKSNADINNQQISFVVRRVEDLNGNPMQNAQMWTTYVNRNVLTWLIDPRTIVMTYGQETTFTALFNNVSGRELNYTISCTCPYIELSNTMGTIEPLGKQGVIVSVSDGLSPGIYQTSLNLTDEDGLCSALTINIAVNAEEPDWQVTTDSSYNQSMDVIGVVKKQNNGIWSLDMCRKDKVAAFIDNECVGVANISVDASGNTSHLYMTVHGKNDLAGASVEFRLWSALDGNTYILDATPDVTFASKSIIGRDTPVEMLAYEMRVQTISLSKGWNWISLFVDPFADKGLNDLFSNQKELTVNDIFRTPFGADFATYQSDGTWDETMDELLFEKENVYQIYAHNEASVEVSGSVYDNPSVTLDFTQSEWAQMAYLSEKSMPVRLALSDFVAGSENAPAGTIIKSYNSFAVANADGTWAGSLEYLRPGEGYFVCRNGLRDNVTIHYNTTSSASTKSTLIPSVVGADMYPDMMPLIAAFADGDLQQGDRLLALVGNEVIAAAEATEGVFFVSLHAKQGEPIVFAKERNGEVIAVTSKGFNFDAQGVAGSMEHPYLIDFTEADNDAPIYDIQGIKYDRIETGTPRVFIQGSKKTINY